MSETIYISRKCEYCHELLILLHQNRDIIKFPVVDVHKSPYPKAVTSVPCMVIDGKVLPGEELFKFINYLIHQNTQGQNSKPKEINQENDLMPRDNPKDFNEPIMNNGQRPNNDQRSIANAGQGPMANAGPMHNGNPLSLNQSSVQKNLNVPGNMQNDTVKQNEPKLDIDDDEMFPGFCVGGVCELGFSSLEDEKDITMDNTFEILDSSRDIEPQMDEGNTKSEKTKQMDDDYSRMMKERGNDLSMKVN